jgi:hypothetical protein
VLIDLSKYPNDDSDFDPRNWERVVERQFVILTNESYFYNKIIVLVRRLITEPTLKNHQNVRLCVYDELVKHELKFNCGETMKRSIGFEDARGIMLAALTEDIIEYYCEMQSCKPPQIKEYERREEALREYVAVLQELKKPKPDRTRRCPFIVGDVVRVLEGRGDSERFTGGDLLEVLEVDSGGDVIVSKDGTTPVVKNWWYSKNRFELVDTAPPKDVTDIINQLDQNISTKGESNMNTINQTIFTQIKSAKANVDALTASITDDQVFEEIVRLEAEVEKYSKTKAQPKAIKDKIAALKAEIQSLVEFSDSRTK